MLDVVETTAQRISRLRISDDGAVLGREIFGPSNLGPGFPDGIAFDVAGNLWCAVAMADRIIALTPHGDVLTLLSDGNEVAALSMDTPFRCGQFAGALILVAVCKIAPGLASIAFGGPVTKQVCLGRTMGTILPYFN